MEAKITPLGLTITYPPSPPIHTIYRAENTGGKRGIFSTGFQNYPFLRFPWGLFKPRAIFASFASCVFSLLSLLYLYSLKTLENS